MNKASETAHSNASFQWKWAAAISLVALLMYGIGTWKHGFVLDDNLVITTNAHVLKGVDGIPALFQYNYAHGHQQFNDGLYRPLSLVTFALESQWFDLDPSISHLIQSILYALALIALMLWLHALLPSEHPWYLWIALLFAIHPIHTEVVANLKGRDELLGFGFVALSAWMLLRSTGEKKWPWLAGAAACFLVALFSKESIITMWAVFPLMLWYTDRGIRAKSMIVRVAVMTIPALLFLGIRHAVLSPLGTPDSGVSSLLQNPLIETGGFVERIFTAAQIQLLYFKQMILPIPMSHDYSYNAIPVVGVDSAAGWTGALISLALLALAVRSLKTSSWWGFGIWHYFITISVVANVFLLIGALAAERFLFLPVLGWCITLVALLWKFVPSSKVRLAVLVGISLVYSVLTATRIPDWKSNESLFLADVSKVEESARAHYNAGSMLMEGKKGAPPTPARLKKAEVHFREALKIWPDYQDAWNNLGITYMNMKNYPAAYDCYTKSIARYPDYIRQRYNMGMTCFQLQKYAEAEQHFERFLESNSSQREILFHLAESEGYQQKFDEAIEHLLALQRLEPKVHRSYLKLGMAYGISGRADLAYDQLVKAQELAPNLVETNYNLAIWHITAGESDQAVPLLQQCLQIDPAYQPAIDMLQRLKSAE